MKITGNFAIFAHDDGTYTVYAHLKPGSVVVTIGDQEEAGALLALVCNSGGSHTWHPHFEEVDRMPPAAANGLPFAFDRFTVIDVADSSQLLTAMEGDVTFRGPRKDRGRMRTSCR